MVVLVVVLVTEVGGRERKWRLRPQPRWRQRVRGSGAKAAGSCSLSSSPSAAWRGERELQVPAGGVRGVVARSFVCSWKRPGRKACYFFRDLVFLVRHWLWGYDYDYQSAVRQWRLLCVWVETLFHLGRVLWDTFFLQAYLTLARRN